MAAPAADLLLDGLEAELRTGNLPPGPALTRMAMPALRLLGALADGRKRLIAAAAGRRASLFRQDPLPGDLVGFMRVARRLLDISHTCHLEAPPGLWFDIHQIYYFALENGHLDTAVPGAEGPASLDGLYKAVLLEAIADPYHMSPQEKLWTRDIIARHGGRIVLARAQDAAQGGVYGVRIHEDKPPQPFSRLEHALPDCDLVLNSTRLARQLALLANQLEQDGGGPGGLRPPAYAALLQRLKQQWGGSLLRNAPRHRLRTPVPCDLLFGFDPLYRRLQQADHGTAGSVGHVLNESRGGMAIESREAGLRLKIGALACVCRGNDRRHHVGLVRWFRTSSDGVLSFGIKFLPGQPEAVTLQRTGQDHPLPGVLLTLARAGGKATTTLLVPPPGPAAGQPLAVTHPRPLRLTPEGRPSFAGEVAVQRCRVEAG